MEPSMAGTDIPARIRVQLTFDYEQVSIQSDDKAGLHTTHDMVL